jgi:hypothetical protein
MLTCVIKINLGKCRKRSRSVAAMPRLSELEILGPISRLPSVFSVLCDGIDFPQGHPIGLRCLGWSVHIESEESSADLL